EDKFGRFARCVVRLLRAAPKSWLLCVLDRSPLFLCDKNTCSLAGLIAGLLRRQAARRTRCAAPLGGRTNLRNRAGDSFIVGRRLRPEFGVPAPPPSWPGCPG